MFSIRLRPTNSGKTGTLEDNFIAFLLKVYVVWITKLDISALTQLY